MDKKFNDSNKFNKLLFAVVQGNDSESLVRELNRAGFYVTILNSMGGFLKRRSTTVMIGLEEEKLPAALEIIKKKAGKRLEQSYQNPALNNEPSMDFSGVLPMQIPCGGCAVFVLDMEKMLRY